DKKNASVIKRDESAFTVAGVAGLGFEFESDLVHDLTCENDAINKDVFQVFVIVQLKEKIVLEMIHFLSAKSAYFDVVILSVRKSGELQGFSNRVGHGRQV